MLDNGAMIIIMTISIVCYFNID